MTSSHQANSKKQALSLFFSGILPVVSFTLIEEKYGVLYGLIAGMSFGVCEIIYEKIRYKHVSQITWIGNSLILALGGISVLANDGIWYKLQPAIFEFGFFLFLFLGWFFRKPFLSILIEKQNPETPVILKSRLSGMTLRLSIFMLAQSALATWAALSWSTEAWALLKGVGLIISMVIFFASEIFWIRYVLKK